MSTLSGYFKETQHGYKSFIPNTLEKIEQGLNLQPLYALIDKATTAIGELRALENLLPNQELLLSKYAMKESLLSSKIEGTQSTLSEILETADIDESNVNKDVLEVRNYLKALDHGVSQLKDEKGLPLSLRLLKDCHFLLMNDVRGGEQNKTPGEFRISQNWIGGTSPKDAIYVPPILDEMHPLLGDLETYIHKGQLPELVKIALLHYQFESIHPFLDGNGRIGRLLITLYLIDKKILNSPTLYLSLFFKRRKGDYYDLLMHVRNTGNFEPWIRFFLEGITMTSNQVMKTTKEIQNLESMDKLQLKTKNEFKLLDYLFRSPVVQIKGVQEALGVSNQTSNTLLKKFVLKGILKPIDNKQRYKKYRYDKYVDIINTEI